MPVDDAHRVVRLGARLDRQRALELGERLRQPVGAPQDEREVVARQRVARCQFERAAEALDRLLDVLLRLRQPQREVAIRIVWRLGDERARTRHGFGSLAGLDQRENQVVRRLPERPAARPARAGRRRRRRRARRSARALHPAGSGCRRRAGRAPRPPRGARAPRRGCPRLRARWRDRTPAARAPALVRRTSAALSERRRESPGATASSCPSWHRVHRGCDRRLRSGHHPARLVRGLSGRGASPNG